MTLVMLISLMPAAMAWEPGDLTKDIPDSPVVTPKETTPDETTGTEIGGDPSQTPPATDPGTPENPCANGHTRSGTWLTNSDSHWYTCTVCQQEIKASHTTKTEEHPATCGEAGFKKVTCSDCGYTISTVEIPATGAHDWESKTELATCEKPGSTYQQCKTCNKVDNVQAIPQLQHNVSSWVQNDTAHSGQCSLCQKTIQGAHNIVNGVCTLCGYTPVAGNAVAFNTNGGTAIATQTVPANQSLPTKIASPSKTGGYTFMGWQQNTSGSLYAGQTNLLQTDTINSMTFSAPTTFYAIYRVNATNQTGSINATTNIGYSLWTHISEKSSSFGLTNPTVIFNVLGGSNTGTLYTSSTQANGTAVATAVPYSQNQILAMTFLSGSSTDSYFLNYTAKDNYQNTVSGYVYITNQAAGDTITITVAPGKTTYFEASKFQAAYRAKFPSGEIDRVSFPSVSGNYSNFSAKIYSGSTELSRSTLETSSYSYSGSSNRVNDLSLRAPDGAKSDTLNITYRAFCGTNFVQGTLELKVSGVASGEVAYAVAPGKEVTFRASDFNSAFQSIYGSAAYNILYVEFSAPASYTTFPGRLYSGTTSFTRADLDYGTSGYDFYYNNATYGKYALNGLSFKADSSAKGGDSITIPFRAYYGVTANDYRVGSLKITVNGEASGDIDYVVVPGKTVDFEASDFRSFFQKKVGNYELSYIEFDRPSNSAFSDGALYHNYDTNSQQSFSRKELEDYDFYYSPAYGGYGINNLPYRADSTFRDTVTFDFTAYGAGNRSAKGSVTIRSSVKTGGDVTYEVAPGGSVALRRTDFSTFFRKSYNSDPYYVVFERPETGTFANGTLYSDFGGATQVSFTTGLGGKRFYYEKANAGSGDYYLDALTFVAGSAFKDSISLYFTVYDKDDNYVDGTLVIKANGSATAPATSNYTGNIRYTTTTGVNVQINANDIARYFSKTYPGSTLQHVTLTGVPATGSLYYNYYNASSYGSTTRAQLTAANCSAQFFYFSPASTSQFALTELTYIPNGANYCASIPFVAYGSNNASLSGTILISVSSSAVAEVYGVTPRNTAVNFPASAIYSAVLNATGTALSGIQLLSLPAATTGTVYLGAGATPANTTTVYTYANGAAAISQLRFVPAATYTGSVEIPYVALSATGTALGCGTFSLGVLTAQRNFGDVNSSTWCYKYVAELSDQNVVSGYADGSFKPNSTVTYGAALKLIMLAAGYPEQAPTNKNSVFSGYLARAQADGIITRSNVSLTAPITRLQVAQLAAGALKLDTSNLSSVKPFTDTADVYVQALNAAGIVEGYFSNGTSTFRPSSTLTRGQMSAIVWRMNQYRK